jgi:hypothetical protein
MDTQAVAIDEINHAMGEIRRASIDDGRNPDFRPPIDPTLDPRGRLHKALDLVDEAKADLGFEEDNMAAIGWRQAAIQHIDAARGSIDRAMHEKHWDERHGE